MSSKYPRRVNIFIKKSILHHLIYWSFRSKSTKFEDLLLIPDTFSTTPQINQTQRTPIPFFSLPATLTHFSQTFSAFTSLSLSYTLRFILPLFPRALSEPLSLYFFCKGLRTTTTELCVGGSRRAKAWKAPRLSMSRALEPASGNKEIPEQPEVYNLVRRLVESEAPSTKGMLCARPACARSCGLSRERIVFFPASWLFL